MTFLLSYRLHHALGAFVCAALLAYALYAEHHLGLMPCPLCVFQRVAIAAAGLGFLIAALWAPRGRKGRWAALALPLVGAVSAIGVAGRHVWLQSLPPHEVPACGPGLAFMMDTLPWRQVFEKVLTGNGQCALTDWSFLGLSMPAWVLIASVGLVIWAFLGLGTRRKVA